MNATSTDWIVPGAEVLRFYDGRAGAPTASRKDVVATVAAKSFTIEGDDYRYSLDDRPTAKMASNAHGSKIRAIPLDSDEARRIIAAEHLDSLRGRAVAAVDAWRIGYGAGDLDATISALVDYRDAKQRDSL